MYDIAVVGDGIVGSLLTYELIQSGKSVLWLGNNQALSSNFSGALINPVAGKHLKINETSLSRYQFAVAYYQRLSQSLGQELLVKHDLLFFDRSITAATCNAYVNPYDYHTFQNDIQSVVRVNDVYKVQQQRLLAALKAHNQSASKYLVTDFSMEDLLLSVKELSYQDKKFNKIVFCEGVRGFKNPLFKPAQFTINYGNVLMVTIPDLNPDYIYDLGRVRLVPCGDELFWCGGNTIWNDIPENQLSDFESVTSQALSTYLGIHKYQKVSHQVVQRPTIAGQQPLFESNIMDQRIMRINGLGTRGYSASPLLIQDIILLL